MDDTPPSQIKALTVDRRWHPSEAKRRKRMVRAKKFTPNQMHHQEDMVQSSREDDDKTINPFIIDQKQLLLPLTPPIDTADPVKIVYPLDDPESKAEGDHENDDEENESMSKCSRWCENANANNPYKGLQNYLSQSNNNSSSSRSTKRLKKSRFRRMYTWGWSRPLIFAVLLMVNILQKAMLADATPEPPNDELILFGAGDGVTDTHFDGSASQFPSPELENVLEAWKPVDYGHPLQDATMFYAPPSLERVVLGGSGRGNAQSRSLGGIGDQGQARAGDSAFAHTPKVVIAAEPKKERGTKAFSIYGNPEINYSKLYDLPVNVPDTLPEGFDLDGFGFDRRNDVGGFDGRESSSPFTSPFHQSAARSRSADVRGVQKGGGFPFDYLPKEIQTSLLIGKSDKYATDKKIGGGLRYVDPPSRQKDEELQSSEDPSYRYYQPPEPKFPPGFPRRRYDQGSRHKVPSFLNKKPSKPDPNDPYEERRRLTKLLYLGEKAKPQKVKFNVHNHNYRKLDDDRREGSGSPYSFDTEEPSYGNEPVADVGINDVTHHNLDDLIVGRESQRHYSKPVKPFPSKKPLDPRPEEDELPSEAVLYSFTNDHGQKQNVGVIYGSNKAKSIPLTNHGSPFPERNDHHDRHFPLGTPFTKNTGKSRPDFFPAQPRPPIFKTRPQKLEGTFGPALPMSPAKAPITYRRITYQESPSYYPPPPPPPPRSNSFRPIDQEASQKKEIMRHWATLVPKQQAAEPAVYKRVRDMDYVRPDFVVHVKDGGQLFLPDPAAADSPNYEVKERIRVEPGHGTLEDQRERDRLFYATSTTTTTTTHKPTTTTATAASLIDHHPHHHHHDHDHHHHGDHQLPWRVDFTDMMGDDLKSKGEDNKKVNPKRSASVEGRSAAPQGDVVFRDPEDFSGDGTFKFPSDSNRGRPQRNIPSNIPRVQINVGSDKRRKLSTTTEAPQAPNYQVVVGLSYDDEDDRGSESADIQVDFDDVPTELAGDTGNYQYSSGELYQLCIVEVPDYLRSQLCDSLLTKTNRRSDEADAGVDEDENIHTRLQPQHTIQAEVVPPRPSNLLHQEPSENSIEVDPLFGIPIQRSVQHLPSTPETEDESSAGYYTNVKVYKPQKTTPATTKTTTTTTTQAPPTLEAAPPPPSVPDRRRNRPLVYSKRNRNTGQSSLSRPFEYLSKFAQYLGGRLPGGRQGISQSRPPTPTRPKRPRLVRKRIGGN